jgi:phosphoribosylamine---glycine ligase
MKILLLGSGGREHALALKLKASARPVDLVSAPGSDALAELGVRVALDLADPAAVRPGLARGPDRAVMAARHLFPV